MRPIVLDKAEAFATRVVNAQKYLSNIKGEKRMSDQLLRSGTAIQALIAEAQYAQSTADFISKMHIALKEANEARNWIVVLHNTSYFDDNMFNSIYDDVNQIVMILSSIVRTTKQKNGFNAVKQ